MSDTQKRRKKTETSKQHIVSVLVENRAGTLSRVSGLFSRRGFNIDSLTVGETEDASVSRMTIAVTGEERVLEQIVKHLEKLVDVIAVRELESGLCLRREIMLVKIGANEKNRPAVLGIAGIFRARVVDVSQTTITVEATGNLEKLNGLLLLLRPYGILELARTGLVALERGTRVLSVNQTAVNQ
jgi:acetolactate synthase-1/3 small subunit